MQCIASLGSQFGFVKQGGLDMGGGKEEWEETKDEIDERRWEEFVACWEAARAGGSLTDTTASLHT